METFKNNIVFGRDFFLQICKFPILLLHGGEGNIENKRFKNESSLNEKYEQ